MTRKKVTVLNPDLEMKIEIYFEDVNKMKIWIQDSKDRELFGANKRKETIKTPEHSNPEARLLREFEKRENNSGSKFIKVKYYEFELPAKYEVHIENYTDSKLLQDKRDFILKSTDWVFISDNPIPTKHRSLYKKYRQHLRDYNLNLGTTFETFSKWVRRVEPMEFLDGGKGEIMIKKFNYYLRYEDV
jgi:hypothetical protein